MATIAIDQDVTTVIIIFTVEPQQQQALIDAIANFLETVKQQSGFVSANLHQSIDGVKVANYAQWQTQADYENFINHAEVQAQAAKLREFDPPDSHVYEVVIAEFKEETSPEIYKSILVRD